MIEVSGVSSSRGTGSNKFMVLDNVSFTIPDKATVAIVGKSGSGKSSLIHIMSGLVRPEFGTVIVNGHDMMNLSQTSIDHFRSQAMGFIFQSFYVQSNQTCAKNVSLPLEVLDVPRKQREKLIDEALNAVGLSDKKYVKVQGLSGGQKQRLAIARAIINRPRFLFADEPTGNLDTTTGLAIENLLFWCNRVIQTTLIIVTHDPELANKCDMQIRISDGKVASITRNGQALAAGMQLNDAKRQFAQAVQQDVVAQRQQHTSAPTAADIHHTISVRQ